MGFLDRARMAFGLDGAEAREERQESSERDEQWGRITAIDPDRAGGDGRGHDLRRAPDADGHDHCPSRR